MCWFATFQRRCEPPLGGDPQGVLSAISPRYMKMERLKLDSVILMVPSKLVYSMIL